MALILLKEELKFVSTEPGEQFVITGLMEMMLKLSATNSLCHFLVSLICYTFRESSFLRFFYYSGSYVLNALPFGSGSGPVFIESLSCRGSELHLLDCMEVNLQRETCTHEDDVSIRCAGN